MFISAIRFNLAITRLLPAKKRGQLFAGNSVLVYLVFRQTDVAATGDNAIQASCGCRIDETFEVWINGIKPLHQNTVRLEAVFLVIILGVVKGL